MKKLLVSILAAILLFSLAACGGASGKNYDEAINALQDRIEQLESNNADLQTTLDSINATDRVYQLGETFTYVSAGIPLFSIKVEQSTTANINYVYITIANINLLGFTPSACVKMRRSNRIDEQPSYSTFSDKVLPIGNEYRTNMLKGSSEHALFGFPTSDGIVPYVTFKVM
jgi:predicted small lipoprotein YifL